MEEAMIPTFKCWCLKNEKDIKNTIESSIY